MKLEMSASTTATTTTTTIPLCNVCLEDEWEQQSICKCNDCNKHLCEVHTGIHKKRPATKDHTLEYLNNNEATTTSTSPNIVTLQQHCIHPLHHYCQEHKDQITEIKCHTCNVLICPKCAFLNHKQHDATLLKDCIKEEKEGLIKLLNEGKEKINQITDRKTRVENTIVKIENRIELNKNEMKNEFNEVYNCLKLKEEQLLKEINDSKKEKTDILENEIKLLNENLQQLNELCQINDLNSLQDIDLGINKLKLENNKDAMNKLILQNKLFNFTNFNFKINTNEIITKINELTKIEEKEELIGFSNQFEFVGQFGSEGSGNGKFNKPFDILIDNDLIYIVDTGNKRISLFNLENNQFIKQFNLNFLPSCIKLDKTNDTLLIGDGDYNVIYRFNKNFELLQQYGNNNGNKSSSYLITGIEVDESNGNIFICNFNNKKVQILTKDFKLIKEFKNNLNKPWDILLNNEKNELIISDCWDHCIKIFTKDGQFIKLIGKYGNKESEFYYLSGFIYDIVNNQYIICDSGNNRIQIFNENFEFIKSFGKEGNGQNEFNWPRNLTINYKTGQLYIVDTDNHCIKIYK